MDTWRARMRAHSQAACLHLFVNEGEGGGASRAHTHAQLLALDFVPALIARERERFGAYAAQTMGQQLLDDLVSEEVRRRERSSRSTTRRCCSRPTPRRLPYQLMLVPRRPRMRFEDDGPTGAAMLHDALRRLARRFGAGAAAEPVDPHRAPRRRALLLAHRHRAAAARRSPGSSSAAGCT
jgi:UDPglucose--hexose-1-phosphate uridylyltransferase